MSYSPYWQVTGGTGTLTAQRGDFIILHAATSGRYELRIVVTPHRLWDQLIVKLQ